MKFCKIREFSLSQQYIIFPLYANQSKMSAPGIRSNTDLWHEKVKVFIHSLWHWHCFGPFLPDFLLVRKAECLDRIYVRETIWLMFLILSDSRGIYRCFFWGGGRIPRMWNTALPCKNAKGSMGLLKINILTWQVMIFIQFLTPF